MSRRLGEKDNKKIEKGGEEIVCAVMTRVCTECREMECVQGRVRIRVKTKVS